MQLIINGEKRRFDKVSTVQDLLDELELEGRIAVEINEDIIPRSRYRTHALQTGDRIEIVHAIGGGQNPFAHSQNVPDLFYD